MARIELVLPAVDRDPVPTVTAAGRLVVPGRAIPERRVTVDVEELARLRDAARAAALSAHCPYSGFHVGAALVMADDPAGRVFTGSNVENASYGGAICAERTAITAASAAGFRRIRLLAVSCADALDVAVHLRSPCGICRQVIAEFTGDDPATLILIDSGEDGTLGEILDLDRLLPYAFRLG